MTVFRFFLIFVSATALASAAETFPTLQYFKAPTKAESRLQAMKNALQPSDAARKGGLSHLSLTRTGPPTLSQMARTERLCAIPLTAVAVEANADLAIIHDPGAGAGQPMAKAPLMPACH